jgi:hypothetical protein
MLFALAVGWLAVRTGGWRPAGPPCRQQPAGVLIAAGGGLDGGGGGPSNDPSPWLVSAIYLVVFPVYGLAIVRLHRRTGQASTVRPGRGSIRGRVLPSRRPHARRGAV